MQRRPSVCDRGRAAYTSPMRDLEPSRAHLRRVWNELLTLNAERFCDAVERLLDDAAHAEDADVRHRAMALLLRHGVGTPPPEQSETPPTQIILQTAFLPPPALNGNGELPQG